MGLPLEPQGWMDTHLGKGPDHTLNMKQFQEPMEEGMARRGRIVTPFIGRMRTVRAPGIALCFRTLWTRALTVRTRDLSSQLL